MIRSLFLAAAALPLLLLSLLLPPLFEQPASAQKPPPKKPAGKAPEATPAASLKTLKDFKVERLYTVPREVEGSWVSMCVDPRGRLIVCDQYGGLFRVTPPPIGGKPADTRIEKIDVPIGEAQGLLWAFDSLYVVVNKGGKFDSGLYRVRDTDGDDKLDKVELLRKIEGGGEHGPHAVLLTPDGKSLTIVCGNGTKPITPLAGSRVPATFGEDHLLPRLPDGRGFMVGVLAPGGSIYNTDPDGKNWTRISSGYRNQYDAAYNRQGELFTYDSDMEWDANTPWYRPTRVCLVTSGSEYGWRNGAGKYPAYYPDNLPGIHNVGPGSPTGVTFGYGAKFPSKYQDAFFICDWSYGKLYALHLKPRDSAYTVDAEEFVSGTPLPLTDLVVNPKDGALYFAVGGRRTQSGLYRVTYVGSESTAPAKVTDDEGTKARALRHSLEAFHGKQDPTAVETVWPYLGHEDRYIRFAARIALEHQDPKTWQARTLAEKDPAKALTALLGLIRASAADPFHRASDAAPVNSELKAGIFKALDRLDWKSLTDTQRTDLLRTYEIALNRLGKPEGQALAALTKKLNGVYPARAREHNAELSQLLVFLEAPGVAGKTLALLAEAPTQEEQLEYARSLRMLKSGWTPQQRKEYFSWFLKAANYKGGNSFGGFLTKIKADAVALLDPEEKVALKPILEAKAIAPVPVVGKPRKIIKKYTVEELVPIVEAGLKSRRDFDRGRKLFGEGSCFSCHRYDQEGGAAGPDLTSVAGRFGVRDLLDSLVEPSKVISDQYAAVEITTTDGKQFYGRIVNLNQNNIIINTNMLDPNALTNVDRRKIETLENSKVSMMPTGLVDTFTEDEIQDLMAYLLSRGDRGLKMFK